MLPDQMARGYSAPQADAPGSQNPLLPLFGSAGPDAGLGGGCAAPGGGEPAPGDAAAAAAPGVTQTVTESYKDSVSRYLCIGMACVFLCGCPAVEEELLLAIGSKRRKHAQLAPTHAYQRKPHVATVTHQNSTHLILKEVIEPGGVRKIHLQAVYVS